ARRAAHAGCDETRRGRRLHADLAAGAVSDPGGGTGRARPPSGGVVVRGYLVVGLYLPPADTVGAALAALRLTRSGGHRWQSAEMEAELSVRGLAAVETCAGPPSVTFVLGQRP